MGERKVLNKYIPSDFDPKLIPRSKKPKDDLVSVRMMLPFTIQCSTCSSFMYRGRKFNSKKEAVQGSEGKYLGIQRWRFYIKCSACSRPLTFLTDPKHADYEMESGGSRTYEVHKDQKKTEEEIVEQDAKIEKEDPMKALENRVLQSQREMKDMDNLDEILAMNRKHVRMMKNGTEIDVADAILKAKHGEKIEEEPVIELDEDDEALIKSIKFKSSNPIANNTIIRLTENEELELQQRREQELEILRKQQQELSEKVKKKQEKNGSLNPLIKVKRKRKLETTTTSDISPKQLNSTKTPDPPQPSALGMLAAYSDSDDSD
jgi:hypothetical protein